MSVPRRERRGNGEIGSPRAAFYRASVIDRPVSPRFVQSRYRRESACCALSAVDCCKSPLSTRSDALKLRASANVSNSRLRSSPSSSSNGTTYIRPERYTPRWRVRPSFTLNRVECARRPRDRVVELRRRRRDPLPERGDPTPCVELVRARQAPPPSWASSCRRTSTRSTQPICASSDSACSRARCETTAISRRSLSRRVRRLRSTCVRKLSAPATARWAVKNAAPRLARGFWSGTSALGSIARTRQAASSSVGSRVRRACT